MIFEIACEPIGIFDYIFAFVFFFMIVNSSCDVNISMTLLAFHACISNYSWSVDTQLLKIQTFMSDLLRSTDMITFSSIADMKTVTWCDTLQLRSMIKISASTFDDRFHYFTKKVIEWICCLTLTRVHLNSISCQLGVTTSHKYYSISYLTLISWRMTT